MKKINLGIFVVLAAIVLIASNALALPSAPGIDKTKVAAQLPEKELQKIIFIRYAPGKTPVCNHNSICESGENWKNCPTDCFKEEPTTACYAFLSGAKPKWNWPENYYYSTSTPDQGLALGLVSAWATQTWDAAVSGAIFGNGIAGNNPWGVYDYKNSVSLGNYDDPDVIAITAIWFKAKNIYEYDIMFDRDYFPNGTENNYDLETVALHEFGHGAGLNDLYDAVCQDNVMYGYYIGEKTFLGKGDIKGIQTLYGF